MHKKVQDFLEKKRQGGEKAETENRDKVLIQLGLWEAEYAPEDNPDSPRYPEKDGERRYRKAPVPVTEEEWAEIWKYARQSKLNKWTLALQIMGGLCYFAGVLGLLQMLFIYVDHRLLWLLFWAAPGTLCFGMAEVIKRTEE